MLGEIERGTLLYIVISHKQAIRLLPIAFINWRKSIQSHKHSTHDISFEVLGLCSVNNNMLSSIKKEKSGKFDNLFS